VRRLARLVVLIAYCPALFSAFCSCTSPSATGANNLCADDSLPRASSLPLKWTSSTTLKATLARTARSFLEVILASLWWTPLRALELGLTWTTLLLLAALMKLNGESLAVASQRLATRVCTSTHTTRCRRACMYSSKHKRMLCVQGHPHRHRPVHQHV
jgi:hypothetical protein